MHGFRATMGVGLVSLSALASASPTLHTSSGNPGPWSPEKTVHPKQALILNRGCVYCHEAIAKEWQASMHAQAYTNPEFQRALLVEPLPFCKGCHAPEANPTRVDDAALQRLGVSCVSCHVNEDGILAAPGDAKETTHPVLRRAAFTTIDACANCHQFAFPGEASLFTPKLMQSTISEFLQNSDPARGCADCHMPVIDTGHRSHRFDVSRNATLLRASLQVSAHRTSRHRVEIRMSSRGVGHAFPTGDLFRRLTIEVEALGPEYSQIESHTAYLTREFETTHTAGGVKRRRPTRDERLPASGPARPFVFEWKFDISNYPIHWRILYQRVQHPGKVGQPDAEIAGEIELATGVLAIEGPKP